MSTNTNMGPQSNATNTLGLGYKSSLTILRRMLLLLRHRFGNAYSDTDIWRYNDDAKLTKINIELGVLCPPEVRGKRPGIYVSRGTVANQKAAIGDMRLFDESQAVAQLMTRDLSQMVIQCESKNGGESCQLADMVYEYIMTMRPYIERYLYLTALTGLTEDPPKPSEKDEKVWVTPVYFTMLWDNIWKTKMVGLPIEDIVCEINQNQV